MWHHPGVYRGVLETSHGQHFGFTHPFVENTRLQLGTNSDGDSTKPAKEEYHISKKNHQAQANNRDNLKNLIDHLQLRAFLLDPSKIPRLIIQERKRGQTQKENCQTRLKNDSLYAIKLTQIHFIFKNPNVSVYQESELCQQQRNCLSTLHGLQAHDNTDNQKQSNERQHVVIPWNE